LKSGKLKHRDLEKKFKTHEAVKIRRKYLSDVLSVKASAIGNIPFEHYNYEQARAVQMLLV
jgi:hydroxymethylglutaryl-CoA reductase